MIKIVGQILNHAINIIIKIDLNYKIQYKSMESELDPMFLMEKFGYPKRNGTKGSLFLTRPEQLIKIQKESLELFKQKNADYGDAFTNYGPIGVIVRIGDKISRLNNISKKSVTMVNDEKLRDTLIDLHNYAAMAIMLIDEPDTTVSMTSVE